MADDIASVNVLLRTVEQRVRLLRMEKSKPEPSPPRMLVNMEANRAYLRNQDCNHGTD
jgi:hypothetical protein